MPLHILILHQHFAINGSPGRRFFEIGRRLAELGHEVTVITGNSELKMRLGKKKVGLLQKNNVAIVVLNVDDSMVKKAASRRRLSSIFARRAAKQVRNLPAPALLLSSMPPLALAGTASSLSSYYRIPLILELREVDDFIIGSQENLFKAAFRSLIRRRALKAYHRADSIIVPSREAAVTAERIISADKMIAVLSDELDYSDLFQKFSKVLTGMGMG